MICAGLTGGIGSGKSYVSNVFERMGIPVYNSDIQARYLMQNDKNLCGQLIAAFGDEIYSENVLQRKILASKVFGTKSELDKLNSLVHPAVRRDFKVWFDKQESPYVIREAAILFESGSSVECDKVILVTASEELRITRVMGRDGVTREEVLKRIRNQWPDSKKIPLANFIIENNGSGMLLPQVIAIHQTLIALSAAI